LINQKTFYNIKYDMLAINRKLVREDNYMFKSPIIFDLGMAICFILFGLWFYKSKGKASNYLTGYNQKSDVERKGNDEVEMCKIYGIRMMCWAIPFIIGAIVDVFKTGVGCTIAWIVWIGLFIWHMTDRATMEKTKKQ
jgi:hypothetical protein